MNKLFQIQLFSAFLFLANNLVFAQCPGCVIDLPALSDDTIWLSDIPDAEVGIYYAEDMSFRLPKTTTPLSDPDTPAGLTISEITITSITNLPPGLQWTASQTEFDTSEETDGCVRICGTPLTADTFDIEINVEAVVFGFPQNTSFSVPMVVHPAVSNTDGFSMTNNVACGSSEVSFTNNVPSGGSEGFSYQWDFGNGTTSTEENPAPVTYDVPGEYIVSYEATVDTAGYFLTAVTVEEAACDDIFGNAPDMSITVNNPDGSTLFETADYENTNPPITFEGFFELGDGEYYMEVIDDDISGDDVCGTLNFTKFSNGTIVAGDLVVTLTIMHLTTTVTSTDTVIIYEQPDAPAISGSVADFTFCQGESMMLTSSYGNNNQWYQDGNPISGATGNQLEITTDADYTVEYTSPDGCSAISGAPDVTVIPAPSTPAYVNENNLLTLFDLDNLPEQYILQWFQDGTALVGENEISYCIDASGDYTLSITDLETGCSNSFTQTVIYNPNVSCVSSISNALADYEIQLTPNPTNGLMQLSMTAPTYGNLTVKVLNLSGQEIFALNEDYGTGVYLKTIDITGASAGMYLVQLQVDGVQWTEKVIKN